jgi:hypothetical protein
MTMRAQMAELDGAFAPLTPGAEISSTRSSLLGTEQDGRSVDGAINAKRVAKAEAAAQMERERAERSAVRKRAHQAERDKERLAARRQRESSVFIDELQEDQAEIAAMIAEVKREKAEKHEKIKAAEAALSREASCALNQVKAEQARQFEKTLANTLSRERKASVAMEASGNESFRKARQKADLALQRQELRHEDKAELAVMFQRIAEADGVGLSKGRYIEAQDMAIFILALGSKDDPPTYVLLFGRSF